jgi:GT2 family glycosyltransferase
MEKVTISIVSHNQIEMVNDLIDRLLKLPEVSRIVLTCNTPETLNIKDEEKMVCINNSVPKGFGANHNKAFSYCNTDYFCVLNPDIELTQNPFSILTSLMQSYPAEIAAPLVLSPIGMVEDSVRKFPSLGMLLLKLLGLSKNDYKITLGMPNFEPDWLAGMFMVFRSKTYIKLNGFDESYFLYYEDVDICRRAYKLGLKIVCCPQVSVVHHAQRASRHNFRHMRWHLGSMLRYLGKSV